MLKNNNQSISTGRSMTAANLAHFNDGENSKSLIQRRKNWNDLKTKKNFIKISYSITSSSLSISSSDSSSSSSPPPFHHNHSNNSIQSYLIGQNTINNKNINNIIKNLILSGGKDERAKDALYWHIKDTFWLTSLRISSSLGISPMEDWEAIIGIMIYAFVAFLLFIGLLKLPSYTIFTLKRLSYYLTGIEKV